MADKRPIDLKRDAGKGMSVGDADEPITEFLKFHKRLFVVKTKSVYEIKLADQIDPGRTNIDVPDTNQKVLNYGSESLFVGRSLLTASELFKERYIATSIDCDQCISFAYEAVKDIASMNEIAMAITSNASEILAKITTLQAHGGAVSVPSLGNVDTKTKEFLQKADHVLQSLFSIAKIFYPSQKRMFEGLYERITTVYGEDDPLSRFLKSNLTFLVTIRRARNAIEHPSEDQKIICTDFALKADGTITPPLLELIDKKTPIEAMLLTRFMTEVAEQILNIFESTIAGLCDKHPKEIGNIQFGVYQFSEGDQGLSKHVRYAHGLVMGDRLVRAQ